MLLGAVLAGCSQKVITQVEYRDRIVYQDRYIHDTINEATTDYIYVKGDTVYREKTKIVYRERTVVDTAYVHETDSIPYPVQVIEYVEKPLKTYQKILIATGIMALALLVFMVIKRFRR